MTAPTLSDQALIDFTNWIKSSEAFLQREIPPTLHEYLVSIMIVNASVLLLSFMLFALSFSLYWYSRKMWKNYYMGIRPQLPFWSEHHEDLFTPWQMLRLVFFMSITTAIIHFAAVAFPSAVELAKCYFTPRIVLIEHISQLLK